MLIQKASVLVVDDDEAVRLMLVTILADRPVRSVIAVGSGAAALAYLDTARPDLIVLDIKMSVMDGFALYDRLREREECTDVPVLFATVLSREDVGEQTAGLAGPHSLIHKPFELADFDGVVDGMLRTDQDVSLSEKQDP